MKVLLINDNPVVVGGAETYTINLRDGLQKRGHEVRILTGDYGKTPNNFADYTFKGINVKSLFRIFPYIFNWSAYSKLKQVLAEFKPDVVHLQYIFYHCSPSILIPLKKVPTILTLHSHDLLAPVGLPHFDKCSHSEYEYCYRCMGVIRYIGEKIKRKILLSNLNSINYFIAPSIYFVDLHKPLRLNNIVQIYNGFKLNSFEKNNAKEKLLFVGRLTKEKGLQLILKGLPQIIQKVPDVHLDIVGTGPHEKYFKEIVKKLVISKNVTFHGKKSLNEINRFYKNTTIVVVPSIESENLPTVCIEAMSVGRPVIGANTGGIPELVDHKKGGFIFTSQKQLVSQVIELLTDKNMLEKLSKGAFEQSLKFGIQEHIQKIENIYKKII